jgi:glycosyltransferase involved in cell wall biosynthesis
MVHIHGIDHKYLAVFELLNSHSLPLVQTLHDHRNICLNGSMYAKGKVCERCRDGKYYHATLQGCVNIGLALSTYFRRTVLRQNPFSSVRLFISPSLYLRDKLKEWGVTTRIEHLYNFISLDEYACSSHRNMKTVIFAGRLTPLKGIDMLLEVMKGLPYTLRVLGNGPLLDTLKEQRQSGVLANVELEGHLQGARYRESLSNAAVMVVPSICPENSPIVIAEAFAMGIPVIGSHLGGIPELVGNEERGMTFDAGSVNDLRQKLLFLLEHPELGEKMGEAARRFACAHFSPSAYCDRIISLYHELQK